jgi:hypothetical protein
MYKKISVGVVSKKKSSKRKIKEKIVIVCEIKLERKFKEKKNTKVGIVVEKIK